MNNLSSRRVLITGAGHGLGLKTARAFARAGALAIITDRESDRVTDAVCELQRESLPCTGYVMDVTDPADVRDVRERLHTEHGRIDVLINNAGIVCGGPFPDVPLEKHLATYDVNTHGPVIVTHLFLQDLIDGDEGHIVNISSAAGMIALPNASTYASSKWALLGFTDSLREELEQNGHGHIGVTAVCPSYINTGMFAGAKPPRFTSLLTPEKLADQILKCVKKNKSHLMTPFMVKLIPLAKATWPRNLFRRLLKALRVYQSLERWERTQSSAESEESEDDIVRVAS